MNRTDDAAQDGVEAQQAAFEQLLADCIAALSAGGTAALAGCLEGRAEHAARVRERLADLERLGLIESGDGPPARIGGHRVLAQLGRGGMSAVYLAEDPDGRRVALKLAHLPLDSGGTQDAEARVRARARFEREVRTVTRLAHPRIVAVRAAGEHEGRPWFSMDYVRGATLARVIERLRARGVAPESLTALDARGALAEELERDAPPAYESPVEEPADSPAWSGSYLAWCCRVAADVASALEHAHAEGIVHRDVKAANVLLRPDGHAQLFDLGLAHVADQPTLTRSGDFAGTPYAVAPEQIDARRGEIDGRTDVWALGVTLYELITLRRPFEAAGPAALLRRILENEPTAPRRHHPGLPRALENVLASALEKDPGRRYASMTALREDLERFAAGRPVQARGAGAARRLARFARAQPALAAAITLGALVAVGLPAGLLAANAAVRAQARRAEAAAGEASRQAAANAEVVDYLVGLFRPLEAEEAAVQEGALAVLETQVQGLMVGFGDQPLVRASLFEATGNVYANLGLFARALPLYDRALAIRQSELGEGHPDTAALLEGLARVHLGVGNAATAAALCRRGLAALDAAAGHSPTLAVRLRTSLGRAESAAGQPEIAAAHLEEALAQLAAVGPGELELEAEVLEQMARVEAQRGRHTLAVERGEAALQRRRQAWLPEPRSLALALDLLAELRLANGDEAGAQSARRDALALREAARAPHASGPLPSALRLGAPQDAEFDRSFQVGITALQARRLDEAVALFESCLALRSGSAVCMYNLACAHALAGDASKALDALERAERAGFGLTDDRLEVLRRDADLAPLRSEPRFQALVERIAEAGLAVRAYVRESSVRVPADAPTGVPLAVLLVLHADGSNREAVLRGPWAQVAEALGAALVVPSAPRARGVSPEQGFDWIEAGSDLGELAWNEEEGAVAALQGFMAAHDVDRKRIYVVGEDSAALLAFDLALRAPGLVRTALLVHGPAYLEGVEARARTAAALGLRVGLCVEADRPIAWVDPPRSSEEYARALQAWLFERGLSASSAEGVVALPSAADTRIAALVEALRAR